MPEKERNRWRRRRMRETRKGIECGRDEEGHRVRLELERWIRLETWSGRWARLLPLGPFYLSNSGFLSI
jgi:hypothetical protein